MARKNDKLNLMVWNKGSVRLIDMQCAKPFDTESAARAYARLCLDHMPGNVLDVLLTGMDDYVRGMIDAGKADILLTPHDLEARFLSVLSTIGGYDEDEQDD